MAGLSTFAGNGHVMSNWYASWFDSPYYHKLYSHRDEREAADFLDRLMDVLCLPAGSRILDLACGRGRHAHSLADKGYEVTGVDLSPANVEAASADATSQEVFFVHDMRQIFRVNYFDAVLNMFTSFGYFPSDHENLSVIRAAAANMKPGGVLVIDFFNAEVAGTCLPCKEVVQAGGLTFETEKKRVGDCFVKTICFEDQGQMFNFEEKVRAFSLEDFNRMFEKNALRLEQTFGDYALAPFDARHSERLIMVARKMC
ncbi:MAG: methyltransferase domain-containing protein [Flavobacteriales bacterium]|nr:methyltransferase domain-containing protein [Flavobacteriales bacterium]MCB9447363.1 methyltransferase domain-containing protein [Flavobacteriales bacterium]